MNREAPAASSAARAPTGSLRTRMAIAVAGVVVVLLVANAGYLILSARQRLRARLEANAELFASLATGPLCTAFEDYSATAYYRFRQVVHDLLRQAPDVSAVEILDAEGSVLFDSRDLDVEQRTPAGARRRLDAERLAAARRLEPTLLRGSEAGRESLQIVSPWVESFGRHRLSVAYHVSYANLAAEFRSYILVTTGLTLASIVVGAALGRLLASRITRPLALLTQGVQAISEGRFERRLEIRSGDELERVATAFNEMAARLERTIVELQGSLAEARRAREELERFAYTASHDLRTPLVTMRSFLGRIAKQLGQGDAALVRGDIERTTAAADRMDRLLREVIDLSRVGRVSTPPERLDLAELAREAMRRLEEAHALGEVAIEIQGSLPTLTGERARLVEVFQNLIGNAAKFMGAQSSPRIVVGARSQGPVPIIFVQDNGIGIEPRYHEYVFGLFDRLDPTREGTGVGLALAKRIVEAHGGRIWVESKGPGEGSTFCFTLAQDLATNDVSPPSGQDR